MVYVFGITSLVSGSPNKRNSQHIFMWESDGIISYEDLTDEFCKLSDKHNIDFFFLRSRPEQDKWHVVSFDILTARDWDKIQAEVPFESDYPQIWERTWDKFWTLRIGKKGGIPAPLFHSFTSLPSYQNEHVHSGWHLDLYKRFCGLQFPDHYFKRLMWPPQGTYMVHYNTTHQLAK